MSGRAPLLALVGFVLGALPGVARACPVCFVGQNEENRVAYVVSSVGLTLLPFVVVGSLLYWVWRRAQAADAATRVERERAAQPAE